ncbi:FliH/SctL family protein [Marinicauda pacifica]|uniref:FliH/SctL family protein n=1 Tax=Marinicauda pacifica TaxID=1133559 RepID=UPI0035C83DFC
MSQAYKPFEFDRVFAEDGTVLRDGHGANNRMLTREEADAHAAEAVDAARKSDEAQASREAAEALRHLSGHMQAILSRMEQESTALREDATRLALAASARIAGKALETYGADTIEECVREALGDLRSEPRISVRVAPHLAEIMAERLTNAAEDQGFEGAVIVRADDQVATGDCALEWRAGVIERTATQIEERIAGAIEKWLARENTAAAHEDDTPATTATGA